MAQWQRARLITARTLDQNQFSVYNHLVALQKLLVITTFKRNRYSSAAERLKHRPLSTRHANVRFWRWLSPYKRKVTGSKPVAGISHHIAPVHKGTRASIKPRVRNYADWSPVSEIETRTEALAFHGFTETIRGNISPVVWATCKQLNRSFHLVINQYRLVTRR